MKARVIGTYLSVGLIILSVFMILIAPDNGAKNILLNMGYGIGGSGIVTWVLTFSEYFVEKKRALKEFHSVLMEIEQIFLNFPYFEIQEDVELWAEYMYLCEIDSIDESFFSKEKEEFLEKLNEYYFNSEELGETIKCVREEMVKDIAERKFTRVRERIDKVLESYSKINNVSLDKLDQAYGNLFFMTDVVKRQKKREEQRLYETFLVPIQEMYWEIYEKNQHFKMYVTGEMDNLPVVLLKLEECNKLLFCIKRTEDENHVMIEATPKFANELLQNIEKFRCEIYNKKYVPIELPSSYVSHRTKKKNVK